ncbi:MAG: serine/threonine-protein kinase [Planctomycetota bacterium]|nr:serine/threonine-protein kinase [Planctomycetota bacterium]
MGTNAENPGDGTRPGQPGPGDSAAFFDAGVGNPRSPDAGGAAIPPDAPEHAGAEPNTEPRGEHDLSDAPTAMPDRAPEPARKPTLRKPAVPKRLGRYAIRRIIGEGAMGVVYEAEQHGTKRRVALKVVKHAVVSLATLKRFELEAELLGRLDDPGIARVYEAGWLARGNDEAGDGPTHQPFLAMEYVDGRPLTTFFRENRLSIRERLEILARVCDAVQHAHARGVIHRDLKPGNILVTRTGQPKILDFGVARLSDEGSIRAPGAGRGEELATSIGQLVGTLAYMSPEQAGGDPAELDVRSDVYSIGVMMYEGLSGSMPYEVRSKLLHEAIRTIREEEPRRLGAVSEMFRGDVETIVAKAMEKDRARRYQTASELSADVGRYLRDEPITARPVGATYRALRWMRKHREWTIAAGVALAAGVVGAGWWITASVERQVREAQVQAEMQAERARADFAMYETQQAKARSAGREGDWTKVRDTLASWAESRKALTNDLVLLGLEATAALEPAALERALTELESTRPELAGACALWRAEPALAPIVSRGRPSAEWARAALARADLSPADRAYAEALQARDVAEASALLDRVLASDPLHRRARWTRVRLSLTQWRTEQARADLDVLVGMSARDRRAGEARALVLALLADRADERDSLNPGERGEILAAWSRSLAELETLVGAPTSRDLPEPLRSLAGSLTPADTSDAELSRGPVTVAQRASELLSQRQFRAAAAWLRQHEHTASRSALEGVLLSLAVEAEAGALRETASLEARAGAWARLMSLTQRAVRTGLLNPARAWRFAEVAAGLEHESMLRAIVGEMLNWAPPPDRAWLREPALLDAAEARLTAGDAGPAWLIARCLEHRESGGESERATMLRTRAERVVIDGPQARTLAAIERLWREAAAAEVRGLSAPR